MQNEKETVVYQKCELAQRPKALFHIDVRSFFFFLSFSIHTVGQK